MTHLRCETGDRHFDLVALEVCLRSGVKSKSRASPANPKLLNKNHLSLRQCHSDIPYLDVRDALSCRQNRVIFRVSLLFYFQVINSILTDWVS